MASHPLFQADQQGAMRRSYVAKDQWGREWAVTTENKTGDVTGIPRPRRWTDPISTPAKFVLLDPRDPNRVVINYDAWIAELEAGLHVWQQRFETQGYDRYGEKFDPEAEPPPYLLRMVGPKPFDPEIVKKAAGGDPEYLGVTPEPRPEDRVRELQARVAELEAEKKQREQDELSDKLTQPLVNRKKKED